MMMKRIFTAAIILSMAAVSCQKDKQPAVLDVQGEIVAFSAQMGSLASKVGGLYDDQAGTLSLEWEEGDQVGVYTNGAPILYRAASAGNATQLTSNIKIQKCDEYIAMYPYSLDAFYEDGRLSVNVPVEQVALRQDYPSCHIAVAKTSASDFAFRNVTAMVRLELIAENVTKIELKGLGAEKIAGEVSVDPSDGSFVPSDEAQASVFLLPDTSSGKAVIDAGVYYVSILPQNFASGFSVIYYAGGEAVPQEAAQQMNVSANDMVICEPFGTYVEGTQSNPFKIGSVDDLLALSSKFSFDMPNYVAMTKDIDMKDVKDWTPICNDRTVAAIPEIHFDGQGFTISNFAPQTISAGQGGGDQASFFGILYGSCRNVNFKDASINQSDMSTLAVVCGFAGYPGRGVLVTSFENVHVTGSVVGKKVVAGFAASVTNSSFVNCSAVVDVMASDNHTGGFVARGNTGNISFENCHAGGYIENSKTNSRFVGGFYGGDDAYSGHGMTFRKCYATGNIKAGYQAAAFVGYLDAGTYEITDCYATGRNEAYGTSKQYGGLVGVNKGNLTVTSSYYSGAMSSNKAEDVGGIVGLSAAGDVKIIKSFSMADLTSPTSGVGGIVGHTKGLSLTVDNCYAAGALSATGKVGGIVGFAETTATVKNCLWGGTGSNAFVGDGQATSDNNTVLTDAQKAEYDTAVKVAAKLGWNPDVWNLSGSELKLK